MNAPTLLLCSTGLAAAVSAGVTLTLAPEPQPVTAAAPNTSVDSLVATLERLAEDQRALTARVEEFEMQRPGGARSSVGEIERLVREALAAQGAALPAEAAPSDAAGTVATLPVDDLVARVLEAGDWDLASSTLWQEISDAGRMDEVLAAFEARAAAAPSDPDVQVELGQAYLAKIQEVGSSPLAGSYAQKADAAFDRALESDPQHWHARFDKAVALSFWPPVFGKQNEAVQQFEILIQQQAGVAPAAHHAESHVLLGNLYQQLGQPEKALAAWQKGAALFPDHAGLLKQLELAQADH